MGGKQTSLQEADKNSPSSSRSMPLTPRSNGSSSRSRASPAPTSWTAKRTSPIVLTDSDKKLLKKSWIYLQKPPPSDSAAVNAGSTGNRCSADRDPNAESLLTSAATSRHLDEIGVLIFLRIFEIAPETREAFPMFRRISDLSTLVDNVIFRCHARRFVRAVESVVNNIDSLELVAQPNLVRLGFRHRDFPGFQPHYLEAFETTMDEIWRRKLGRRRYGRSTRRAWRKVFELITSTVLDGYLDDTDAGDLCCGASPVKQTTEVTLLETAETNGNGCATTQAGESDRSLSCPLSQCRKDSEGLGMN